MQSVSPFFGLRDSGANAVAPLAPKQVGSLTALQSIVDCRSFCLKVTRVGRLTRHACLFGGANALSRQLHPIVIYFFDCGALLRSCLHFIINCGFVKPILPEFLKILLKIIFSSASFPIFIGYADKCPSFFRLIYTVLFRSFDFRQKTP